MGKQLSFPDNFLFGASTASYQIEGAWNKDGKGESIWDRFTHTPGNIDRNETGDTACDHYHRYREDVDFMKQIGLTAYRFSISWSRVLPGGRGTPSQKGLDFYSRLTDALLEKEITPIVTLYHWDLPQALHNAGNWLNRRTITWFTEYASLMYRTLGDRVTYWTTFNEPFVCANLGFHEGTHAPGVKDQATSLQVFHHILVAHGDAVRAGRELLPDGRFSIAPALLMAYPASDDPIDAEMAEAVWQYANAYQLDPIFRGSYPEKIISFYKETGIPLPEVYPGDMERISVPLDFLGVNHYFSLFFIKGDDGKPEPVKSDEVKAWSDLDWPVYPAGMTDLLERLRKDYGDLPLIITENGLSLNDTVSSDGKVHDTRRAEYIRGFCSAVHRAIDNGVDVRGYCHWSLMDNFEWAQGYKPRFGLVHINYETQERTIKESAKIYSEIIRNNGLEDFSI
jgi:beta-glucosidase